MDFPPPVGKSASVSLPSITEFIMSSCNGLKVEYPQYFCNMSRMGIDANFALYEDIYFRCRKKWELKLTQDKDTFMKKVELEIGH